MLSKGDSCASLARSPSMSTTCPVPRSSTPKPFPGWLGWGVGGERLSHLPFSAQQGRGTALTRLWKSTFSSSFLCPRKSGSLAQANALIHGLRVIEKLSFGLQPVSCHLAKRRAAFAHTHERCCLVSVLPRDRKSAGILGNETLFTCSSFFLFSNSSRWGEGVCLPFFAAPRPSPGTRQHPLSISSPDG